MNTLDSTGKPIFTATPTQTVADLQAGVDYAERIAGGLKGTAAARDLVAADEVKLGWLFVETDTGRVYEWTASGWVYLAGGDRATPYRSNTKVAGVAALRFKTGVASGTTTSGGVLLHTFPEAFEAACSGVLLMPDQNSNVGSAAPVMVDGGLAASGFQTFWAGRGTAAVSVAYFAFGY